MNLKERYENFGNSFIIDKMYYLFLLIITITTFGAYSVFNPTTKEGMEIVGKTVLLTNSFWLICFFGGILFFMVKILISRFNEIRNKIEK